MGDRYINNSNGNVKGNSNSNGNGNDNGNENDNDNDNDNGNTIWYIDANNLYSYAMMQKLPYKDLQHITITLDECETTLQRIFKSCKSQIKKC